MVFYWVGCIFKIAISRGFHRHGGSPIACLFQGKSIYTWMRTRCTPMTKRTPPYQEMWQLISIANWKFPYKFNKWRFIAGKIISFYGPWLPVRYVSHNQRVNIWIEIILWSLWLFNIAIPLVIPYMNSRYLSRYPWSPCEIPASCAEKKRHRLWNSPRWTAV